MKIKETIQDKLLLPVLVSLLISGLALIGYFLSPGFQKIYLLVAQIFYTLMGAEGELTLILLLLVLNVATWTYILPTRNKRKHYHFDKRLGIYFHKKTGEPFCSACFVANLESPLKEESTGWVCCNRYCNKAFKNPDAEQVTSADR